MSATHHRERAGKLSGAALVGAARKLKLLEVTRSPFDVLGNSPFSFVFVEVD